MLRARRWTGLLLALPLGCASAPPTLLPSASDPAARQDSAPGYRQIRVENGGHRGAVWDVAFSPDSRRVYSAGDDKVVRVWDTHEGTLLRTLRIPIGPAQEGAIFALDVSPDERWVAVGGCHGCEGFWGPADSHLLFLLDARSGHIAGVGQGHRWSIRALAFSPDGQRLASGSVDQALRIWSVGSDGGLSAPTELLGHGGPILDVAWYPDGQRVVTAGGDNISVVWGVHPAGGWYPELVLRGHTGSVFAVAVSRDGTRIATSAADGSMRLWDAQNGEPLGLLEQLQNPILGLSFSPDGARVAYAAGDRLPGETGVGIVPVVADPSQRIFETSSAPPVAVAWSPDGYRLAASEAQSGKVVVRTASTLSTEHVLRGTGSPILRVGTAGDDPAWQHALGEDGWSRLDVKILAIQRKMAGGMIVSGVPHPRIRRITMNAGESGIIAVEGRLHFRVRLTRMWLVSWSLLGGTMLGVGSWDGLHLLDFGANVQRDCRGHESAVLSVSPYARGALVLTGSADQTLRVWDPTNCSERLAFYADERGGWAAWTPDGAFVSSRGGESLLGVHTNRGAREAPTFEPVTASMRRDELWSETVSALAATAASAEGKP